MVDKEFVPYEEALALKEIGFNEPCFKYIYVGDTGINVDHYLEVEPSKARNYNEDSLCISQPTFSQAFRWFDENTECSGYIVPSIKEGHFDWLIRIDWEKEIECEEAYSSRIEAELACLKKLIEIVKKIKKS